MGNKAESKIEKNLWWVGSDDGLIHISTDGLKNWTNVTPSNAPNNIMWNSIDPHPTTKGGAYIAGTTYKSGNFQPYLYKTTNYGKSWEKITNGIDALHFTRVVRADPSRNGLLYAGTEYGMYISFDDGRNWKKFQLNLPMTPITDLLVKQNSLVVATQGRSIWIIDDLSPLHQLNDDIVNADFHLFSPKESYRMRSGRGGGNSKLNGTNHPSGTMIYYHVKDVPDQAKLEILEEDGDVIKTYDFDTAKKKNSLKVKEGLNYLNWNMRYPDATTFDGIVLYSSSTRGPLAPPGNYKLRLTVDDEVQNTTFNLIKDLRTESSDADLQKQFDFLIGVRDKLSQANQAVIDIRSVKEDINYLRKKLKDKNNVEDILNELKELESELTVVENNIHETRNEARQDPLNFGIKLNNQLAFLATTEGASDFPPTDQAIAYKEEVSGKIDTELEGLSNILSTKLADINQMIAEKNIPFISIGNVKKTDRP